MKTLGRNAKLRLVAIAGAALVAIGLTTVTHIAGASEQQPTTRGNVRIALPPDVAAAISTLSPGAGFVPVTAYRATGTQTYTCQADGTWPAKSTPEAQLTKLIGTGPSRIHHYGGPRWSEVLPGGVDGSTLLGTVVQPTVPVAGTIPWLLLTTAHEGPSGQLDRITHINRVLTSGGTAPAGACTPAQVGDPVPYRAVYVFWAAAG